MMACVDTLTCIINGCGICTTWNTYVHADGEHGKWIYDKYLFYAKVCAIAIILSYDYGRDLLFLPTNAFFASKSIHRTVLNVISLFHPPWMAIDRSTELKLLAEYSLSELLNRLPFRNGPLPRLMRFCDKCSPHKFEPPCVYGMFSSAMPCKCGPLAKSNETPSHWPPRTKEKKKKQWKESELNAFRSIKINYKKSSTQNFFPLPLLRTETDCTWKRKSRLSYCWNIACVRRK